jgi:hypothetical protein
VTGFSNDASADIQYLGNRSYGHKKGMGFTHNSSQNISYIGNSAYDNGGHGFNSEVGNNILYANNFAGGVINSYGAFPFAANDTLGNGWSGFRISASTGPVILANCVGSYNDSSGIIVEGYATQVSILGGAYNYNHQYGIYIYWADNTYSFGGNPSAVGNGAGPLYLLGSTGYSGIPTLVTSIGVNRSTMAPAKMALSQEARGDTAGFDLYKLHGGVVLGMSNGVDFKAVISIDSANKALQMGTHSSASFPEFVMSGYRVMINGIPSASDSIFTVEGIVPGGGSIHAKGNVMVDGELTAGSITGSVDMVWSQSAFSSSTRVAIYIPGTLSSDTFLVNWQPTAEVTGVGGGKIWPFPKTDSLIVRCDSSCSTQFSYMRPR